MGFNPRRHAFSAAFRGRWATRTTVALASILAGALTLRLVLLPVLRGRQTHDLRIFVSWAHLLMQYGPHGLYAHVDTIDHYPVNYPPVYALSLAAVVALYQVIVHGGPRNDLLLGMLLKLPAIAADLALCSLAFVIVRRWLGSRPALFAAAIAAFAPSTWPISAVWGQVDSMCSAFLVLSLALAFQRRFVPAWSALALGILVKPFPIAVAPLLFAAQAREGWTIRLWAGPASALVIAYVASLPFAPTIAPLGALQWLARQYVLGGSLSQSTSVNAYNVWTILRPPVADTTLLFGVTLHLWGWVAATVLIGMTTWALFVRLGREGHLVSREMLTTRAWFIVLSGLFIVLTRMHERYVLFALALAPLMWYCGRWERQAALTLIVSFTLCVTLVLGAYERSLFPAIPFVSHALSLVNTAAVLAVMIPFFSRRSDAKP